MCFLCLEEGENVQKVSRQRAKPKKVISPWSRGCLGPFIAPTRFTGPPQKDLDWVNLDTPGNILTSCF